ncbi:MAG: chloride channel protein [Ignavibacteria bacterium]|nr:chloride channel protein [Ignavibacteria bacterium]
MQKTILFKILDLRRKYISNHTFLIIAAIIVGIASSFAAILLKTFVHFLRNVSESFHQYNIYNVWLFVLPIAGILISTIILKLLYKKKTDKGLGGILYAISHKSSKVEGKKTYSHILTSGITIGLGGSAGLEAPIAITGSAIGSNISDLFMLGQKERTILLACGAASGIASVFNSPIAGVIFAMEVLLTEFSIPSFIPLLISTASATIISKLLYGGQLFYLISNEWYFNAIPFYIFLGILCGLISVYMKRVTLSLEEYFDNRKDNKRILFGLVLTGLLIFIFPPLFGEGYNSIDVLLTGNYYETLDNSLFSNFSYDPWFIIMFAVFIVFLKVVATALTIGSGGNGGIFAPSLFTGAFTGFGLAHLVNTTGINKLNVSNFIVVGMAGILSGVVHAPLTAIFLIAEITGGYVLFVPLMIVVALSYFITRIFEPHSIYTKKLAETGHLLTGDKDSNVLMFLNVSEVIEKDFIVLRADKYLNQLIEAFSKSNRTVFPVVNEKEDFIGVVFLYNVKDLLFEPDLYDKMLIQDLTEKIVTIDIDENMESVMNKFEKSNLWNIPVVSGKKYLGFVSRSNIFTYYRNNLKKSNYLL